MSASTAQKHKTVPETEDDTLAIKRVAVTVDVDGVECTVSLADFKDGGANIWANLPEKAANLAKIAAGQMKESVPNLLDEPKE